MIKHLDHLVLTTVDVQACKDFYMRVLGMQFVPSPGGRMAFHFGQQKINVHVRGFEFEPCSGQLIPDTSIGCFHAIARS